MDNIITEDQIKIYDEDQDKLIYMNEALAGSAQSTAIKKIVYDERIRNNKEMLTYYDGVKATNPFIRKTYVNVDMYKKANLFVDLCYYTELFNKNNKYQLDKGVDLYYAYIQRLLKKKKFSEYTKFTIFVPADLSDWKVDSVKDLLNYKVSINPMSLIYRLATTSMTKLSWLASYDILFITRHGYFKLAKNISAEDMPLFKKLLTQIQDKFDDEEDHTVESPKTIVANIVNKIEKSQGITINNLTGQATKATPEEIGDKVTNAAASAAKLDKQEADKAELVNHIKAAVESDPEIKNTDDAIDTLENDEKFKQLLIDLSNEEDNKVKINAARASRIAKLQDTYKEKEINGVKVRDLLEAEPLEGELPETALPIDSPNEEWQHMQFRNFNKVYDMDRDIALILNSFSEMSVPVSVLDVQVEDTSTSEDFVNTYTVKCEDVNGQRFTLKFDVPIMIDNRSMKLRGNNKIMSGQLMLLPVIKTDEDTVQIVSNYNKIFVSRYGSSTGKSYQDADRIVKALGKKEFKNIKISRGDNSKICSKYELPIDYIDLASEFNTIETKDFIFYFNQDEIRNKYQIPDNTIPIGYDKKMGNVIYYAEKIPFSTSLVAKLKYDEEFAEVYDSTSIATKYTYSKASILATHIPVIVILSYNIGLTNVLERANIEYNLTEKRPAKNPEWDVIKFSDGFLSYRLTYESSLLMNGLKECDTANYSIGEVNGSRMWLESLDQFGGRIKADGLDNFYDLMIDPITKEVCQRYNLPDNYVDIMIYASNLLADNKYNRHVDITGNRYRNNEMVAGYIYKALAESYARYRNELKHNRKGTTMSIKQAAVIDKVMLDPILSDESKLNPLLEFEAANAVSFKGLSGMNSDRAYGLDKRTYDSTMTNVLALSTGFATNVGITRQSTIDMNIEGGRGYIKSTENPENMSVTKSLCMTEALTPFGSNHDDPFRSAMTFIQTSKHTMRTKVSHPALITNGADEALPYLTSDTFSFKAKDTGTIAEKTDDYMIIKYKDGKSEYVDLRERVMKNSDGGFYITVKLSSKYRKGQKVKEGDIVAYDEKCYSDIAGPTDNISYTGAILTKLAILNTDEGFEDSAIITEWMSEAMASEVVVQVPLHLPANANIYNVVKKGQAIQEGESLIIFQNAFDEDEMNALLKNLTDEVEVVSDLGRIPVKSKVTGIVQDIRIYRTVDKEELSDSLKKLVTSYEKDIKQYRKVMDSYGIKGVEMEPDYKLDATGKLKHVDGVLIEFYLKYNDTMSTGDKIVYSSALKGTVKDIVPVGDEPYSSFRPDEKLGSLLAVGAVTGRMVGSIMPTCGINKVMIELERACKEVYGLPWKYLNQ